MENGNVKSISLLMKRSSQGGKLSRCRNIVQKNIDGSTKALALMAREMADNKGGRFKSANKVNAKGFKDHILELAEQYEISDGYLKSLDDKLNQALNDLELKEIPPSKK